MRFFCKAGVLEVVRITASSKEKNQPVINETEQQKKENSSREKQRSPMTPIQVFLLNLLIVITVAWLLFGFVIGAVTAPNNDMAPAVKAKDLLLYYRLDKTYRSQDTVVFEKNGTTYIGRVVAVPGDSVDISDAEQLIINSNIVSEPEIRAATPRFEGFVEYPVQLRDNEYFILADARSGAEDSRYFGTVSYDEISGKVITVIRRHGI